MIDLCFCLYHFKYSDALSSLKSAARSISVFFSKRWLDISCASPFGRAVKITSTSLRYTLLNFVIFGNFLKFNDLSKILKNLFICYLK